MKKKLFINLCLLLAAQFTYSQCSCSTTSGWSPVVSTYPIAQTVSCGYQFFTHAKDTVNFSTQFHCSSMPVICNTTYKAELKKNGILIQAFSPFTFPYVNIFNSTGNYSLTIYPFCDGNMCSNICTLYFKVQ
jgi:hypothetical protein